MFQLCLYCFSYWWYRFIWYKLFISDESEDELPKANKPTKNDNKSLKHETDIKACTSHKKKMPKTQTAAMWRIVKSLEDSTSKQEKKSERREAKSHVRSREKKRNFSWRTKITDKRSLVLSFNQFTFQLKKIIFFCRCCVMYFKAYNAKHHNA